MDDIRIPCIVWFHGDPPPDLSGISNPIRIPFVLRRHAANHHQHENGAALDIEAADLDPFPQHTSVTTIFYERAAARVDERQLSEDDEMRRHRNARRRQAAREPFDQAIAISSATGGPASEQPHSTPSGFTYGRKIQRQMSRRGFTPDQIDEAVAAGDRVSAVNRATGGPATRYINPSTGQSVIIDDTTHEVIHVGGPGFEFGPNSGDAPGAKVTPAPRTDTAPEVPGLPPETVIPDFLE